jgi:hypothetical protein
MRRMGSLWRSGSQPLPAQHSRRRHPRRPGNTLTLQPGRYEQATHLDEGMMMSATTTLCVSERDRRDLAALAKNLSYTPPGSCTDTGHETSGDTVNFTKSCKDDDTSVTYKVTIRFPSTDPYELTKTITKVSALPPPKPASKPKSGEPSLPAVPAFSAAQMFTVGTTVHTKAHLIGDCTH